MRRLEKSGQTFVLVFGSLEWSGAQRAPASPETPKGRPILRFVYQEGRNSPVYALASLELPDTRRFYAVLKPPAGLDPDQFYMEAGSEATGFDRILYVHVGKRDGPVAMYVGEIRMAPAARREAQGEKVAVAVRDDFASAEAELKRLYPAFKGTMDNEARLLPKKLPGE